MTTTPDGTNAPNSSIPAPTLPAPVRVDELIQRCVGSASVAVLLLDKFERQLHAHLREIETGLTSADGAGIAGAAGALKGVAGTVAAVSLQRVAAGVEAQGRAGNLQSLVRDVNALRAEVERCLGYLPEARLVLSRV